MVYEDAVLALRAQVSSSPKATSSRSSASTAPGKTTMLRAITGLLDVHRGEITRGSRSPSFEDLVLESGYNYCVESMNGLDWASETFGKPDTLMSVHYPGDYGGDSAAGVSHWAMKNSVAFPKANDIQTLPNAQAGNQDGPVRAILRTSPDIVMIATGPAEMAEIVG